MCINLWQQMGCEEEMKRCEKRYKEAMKPFEEKEKAEKLVREKRRRRLLEQGNQI